MSTNQPIVETEAAPPIASLPGPQTGVAPRAPQPVAPPQAAYDPERFSVAGRVVCGVIAAAFALGLYAAPTMRSLWFVYAIFAFGVFVFGQIAVFGRFGRKAGP